MRFLLGDPNSIAAVVKDKHKHTARRPIKPSHAYEIISISPKHQRYNTIHSPRYNTIRYSKISPFDILKYRRVAITVAEWKEIFRCRRDATPYCINSHRGNPFSMFPRPWIHRADPRAYNDRAADPPGRRCRVIRLEGTARNAQNNDSESGSKNTYDGRSVLLRRPTYGGHTARGTGKHNRGRHILEFSFFRSTSRRIITRCDRRRKEKRREQNHASSRSVATRKMYSWPVVSFSFSYITKRGHGQPRRALQPVKCLPTRLFRARRKKLACTLYICCIISGESGHPVGRDSLCCAFVLRCRSTPADRELLLSSVSPATPRRCNLLLLPRFVSHGDRARRKKTRCPDLRFESPIFRRHSTTKRSRTFNMT